MALPLSYHWRSLFVRKTTTILTVLVLAAVVGVLTWMLGLASALSGTLASASEAQKIMVLKRGATSESNSAIPVDEYTKLSQLTALERDGVTGEPLISPEMVVQIACPRLNDGGKTWSNLALRGVTETAFKVHRTVRLSGPSFSTGAREVVVGAAAAKQFGGLQVGGTINLGYGNDRGYKVVGTFTAGGSPAESEVWGYLPSLMNSYNRTMYSSVMLRLREGTDSKPVLEQIRGPAIQLEGRTESQYWTEQASSIRTYLRIAYYLIAVMSLAAIFAVANTMFSMVAGRTREIAMLRTIGYTSRGILSGFVVEAVFISMLGAVLGCLGCAAWLWVTGNTKDMFGATTFTTLAFEIRLTPPIVGSALAAVSAVGILGALWPACRAARLQVVSALREP